MQADPEELMEFAGKLDQFNCCLTTESSKLEAEFRSLGFMWKEQDYTAFTLALDRLMRNISTYLKDAAEYPELLEAKARTYLEARIRMP